jgi:hypothetical protein
VVAYSFGDSRLSWIRMFLVRFLFCHCMAGHPSVGNGHPLPRSTISSGPFLHLLAVLYSQLPDPTPLPQSSDWSHYGFSHGDS